MPWAEEFSDPQELQRCIRDLVALSTLPTIWREFDPQQIADSVGAALVSIAGLIEISIADSGVGLAEDMADHLFEPFVSGRSGMGLGLSITRSIVEAHGGKIDAKPNPNGGAIFRFTLTASQEADDAG